MNHGSASPTAHNLPHVVIIGAGFGGLEAAKTLGNKPVKVTIIDRNNHHVFQPLLYQVATAGLSPADIAVPIRSVLHDFENVSVLMGTVQRVDVQTQKVHLEDAELRYDYLIVAAGATHSYFGHDEWSHLAPGLKSVEDATEIRRRVLLAFERAERFPEKTEKDGTLNFVIVGGGATGVELAGALAELARYTLSRDFRHIHSEDAKVILLEAGDRILTAFPETLSNAAMKTLRKLKVDVRLNSPVTKITENSVTVANEPLPTHTVIWAAGVRASPLAQSLGAPLDKAGRVLVKDDLSLPNAANVFVVGDLAFLKQKNGNPVPGVAPAALQEGHAAAQNIIALIKGLPTENFSYFNKGNLATIGRGAAIAEIGDIKLKGFLAWLVWVFVHIVFLISFRNRLLVIIQWALAYYTYQRGARLITKDLWANTVPPEKQLKVVT